VRDRGRMLQQLLAGVVPSIGAVDAKDVGGVVLRRAQVRVVLFEGKENAAPHGAPHHHHHHHHHHNAHEDGSGSGSVRERLGTLGLVLGRDVPDARLLPDWLEHGVESSLRHSPDDAPSSTSAVTAIGHVAPSRVGVGVGTGTGGRSTPIVVLTPAGSDGPSPAGSVPNRAGWADLDKFYASDSEEEEEDEDGDEEDEGEGEEGESEEDGDEEDGERSEEESDRQSRDEGDSRAAPKVDEDEESDVEEGISKMAPLR